MQNISTPTTSMNLSTIATSPLPHSHIEDLTTMMEPQLTGEEQVHTSPLLEPVARRFSAPSQRIKGPLSQIGFALHPAADLHQACAYDLMVNKAHIYAEGAFCKVKYGILKVKGPGSDIETAVRTIHDHSKAYFLQYEHTLLEELRSYPHPHSNYIPQSYGIGEVFHLEEWIPHSLASYLDFTKQEYLEANTLDSIDRSSLPSPIPLKTVYSIAHHLLSAIHFIHAHGVIHCDISPENIGFTDLSTRTIKILDFSSSERAYTEKGPACYTHVKGKSQYRAPELVKPNPFNFKIDLYSLGVLFFRLCGTKDLFPSHMNPSDLQHYQAIFLPYRRDRGSETQVPFELQQELNDLLLLKTAQKRSEKMWQTHLRRLITGFLNNDPNMRPEAMEILANYFPDDPSDQPLFPETV